MKTLLTIIAAAALLLGCAGSPIHMSKMPPAELAKQTDIDLCYAYGIVKSDSLRTELKSRKTIKRWDLIDAKKIQLGMTNAELLCSWGAPQRVNKSVGSYGVHKQYVYGTARVCRGGMCMGGVSHYVYIENGILTSWQD